MHSQYGSKAKHTGEMAEWSIAAVLKTVDCNRSGGSNPSFSAEKNPKWYQNLENPMIFGVFCFYRHIKLFIESYLMRDKIETLEKIKN